MVVGAVALAIYATLVGRVLWKASLPVALTTTAALAVWLGIAVAGWAILLR
jgi:hypothetical protein